MLQRAGLSVVLKEKMKNLSTFSTLSSIDRGWADI